MKLRRLQNRRPKPDRWVAFDSLPAPIRRALAEADYPLDPLKLVGSANVDEAVRRVARLDAAARRRTERG
jgi:hypothetical protein